MNIPSNLRKILFVCHGNICRSPMAEFVMKDLLVKAWMRVTEASVEVERWETLGEDRVGTGRFGAGMKVRLLNDGPFSVELTAQ